MCDPAYLLYIHVWWLWSPHVLYCNAGGPERHNVIRFVRDAGIQSGLWLHLAFGKPQVAAVFEVKVIDTDAHLTVIIYQNLFLNQELQEIKKKDIQTVDDRSYRCTWYLYIFSHLMQ